ncbi:hypothetical protein Tco_1343706 [Tanacetum coccineum]
MTSFDCRLKAIKACSACGNLHTSAFCCSKEKLKNKILVPMPESSQQHIKIERICFDCGDLLHGLNCLECDLTRKILEKAFQKFQNTSKSSNDNSNVVNAPREPFVVKQDPSVFIQKINRVIQDLLNTAYSDSLDKKRYDKRIGFSMAKPNEYIFVIRKNFLSNDNEGRMVEKSFLEIQGTFLVKIHDNTFNGIIVENAFKHIDNFLEVVGPLKIKGLRQDRFRLSVFPISLAGAMETDEDDDPNDIADIFKIEGNLFDFETLCVKHSMNSTISLKSTRICLLSISKESRLTRSMS